MSLAVLSKVNNLLLLVCFIKIQIGSPQFSSFDPSRQTDSQIRAIVKEIRSYRFDLAEEQLLNLKDTNKIAQVIRAAYRQGQGSLVDILDFANALTRIDLTFYVLKALRREMSAENERDPLKLIALAQEFLEGIVYQGDIDGAIKAEATQTVDQIQNEIKVSAIEELTAAMLSNGYSSRSRAGRISENIFTFQHLSEEIMREMVNRTYNLMPAFQIVKAVMLSNKYIPQKITVFLQVFSRLEKDNDLDNDAVLEIAYNVRQLQDHQNFLNLYPNQKFDVNAMIDRLPACARNLFFSNEVCIWNRGRMEYLYADDSKDHLRERSVYTCGPDDLSKREGGWFVGKRGDDFLFKSQAFKKEYLGVGFRKTNLVTRNAQTQEDVRDNDSNTWKVELIGEYCYLKNQYFNEYLFAGSKQGSGKERMVFSARANAHIERIHFQWQIRDCS